jgi:hypothetical protein
VEVTDTFKPARRVYVDEGFDRERIEDPLYVFDDQRRAYVPLDADRHAAIRDGALRPQPQARVD